MRSLQKSVTARLWLFLLNTVSYKFAQDVKTQLEKAGCKILGVILNKVDMSGNSYYGKYYGKYYGQYYGKDKE